MSGTKTASTLRNLATALTIALFALGYFFPRVGLIIPAVMAIGVITATVAGRWFCGHICPRGILLDQLFGRMRQTPQAGIPKFFWRPELRFAELCLMTAFLTYSFAAPRLPETPDALTLVGYIFWKSCVASTGLALAMAILIHPRSWCLLCPAGTINAAFGRLRRPPREFAPDRCLRCDGCRYACPLSMSAATESAQGLTSANCLRCDRCAKACPTGALAPKSAKSNAVE